MGTSFLGFIAVGTFIIVGFENCSEKPVMLNSASVSDAPSISINANPAMVSLNSSSTLTWSSENVISCIAIGNWTGAKSTAGSESTGNLTAGKIYGLTCTGPNGSVTESIIVNTDGSGPPTMIFTASPTTVAYGASSRLTWSSVNATSCTNLSNLVAGVSINSPIAISGFFQSQNLIVAKDFRISCSGPGGNIEATASVNVLPPVYACPVIYSSQCESQAVCFSTCVGQLQAGATCVYRGFNAVPTTVNCNIALPTAIVYKCPAVPSTNCENASLCQTMCVGQDSLGSTCVTRGFNAVPTTLACIRK